MKKAIVMRILAGLAAPLLSQNTTDTVICKIVEGQIKNAKATYEDLHQNPELSLMEFKTAEKMAKRLTDLGFEVTTNVGGNGVVGVFRNGKGKTIICEQIWTHCQYLNKPDSLMRARLLPKVLTVLNYL